jgi:3-phosphoshikimate 1-carboxyvinyltransferase
MIISMSKVQLKYASSGARPVLRVPSSKSISNRLLILQSISNQRISIRNLSTADDTVLLSGILKNIRPGNEQWQEFHCGNAGTVFRFLTAYLAFTPGKFILTGDKAMEHRPVFPLVDALRHAGIQIDYRKTESYPPLEIHGKRLSSAPDIRIDAGLSSQFVSALLLVAPMTGMKLSIEGFPVSRPYVELTKHLLQQAGVPLSETSDGYQISRRGIQKQEFTIEADWSSAAPWYVLTALEKKG